MGILDFLFPSTKRRKRASKKKAAKKATSKTAKGLKHFAVFDGDTDKLYSFISGKTETQAFKEWAKAHPKEAETARIISKKRWETET